MLDEMPSRTLTEWMAYRNLEPFGDELLDIHLANLTATLANANRAKGAPATKPEKFRLWKEISTFNPREFFEGLKSMMARKE